MNMYDALLAGGLLMLPLVGCSLFATLIILERLWSLRIARIAPPHLGQEVCELIQQGQVNLYWLESHSPLGGILAEVSIGALMHDEGPFSNSKEEGYDGHIELRFASPKFLELIWSPEPHIGANINSKGDTSQVFAGLSYEYLLWKGLFVGLSVGGAYHDGETDSHRTDKKDLGCHLLFRESLTLGWQLTEHHKIAAIFDHISNAKICDHNEGLENIGVRYSYRF